MDSIDQHPLVQWLGAATLAGGIVATCVGAYLFLDDLKESTDALHDELAESIAEKKALDIRWLDLDREDHQNILNQVVATQAEIKLLVARLGSDGALLYQVGLRDGMALCRSQQEN